MHLIYFILILLLSDPAPQAYAIDLGDTLKEIIKSNSEAPPPDASGDNKTFNLKNYSGEEEMQIGREIAGNLLGASPLVKDAALQKYINQVGRWVASQSERDNLSWHFGVIESEDINAFAMPGGYVVVTKGLYRKLQNEAQLAGVLAHEIAHIVQNHHIKLLQKTQLLDLGADLIGKQIGRDNRVIKKIIGSGAEICARSLDKDAEFEADRMGVTLTARSGYEPYGLPEVLQVIGQTNTDDGSVGLLFKTHPHPDDRLVKLDEAIGNRLDIIKNSKTLSNRLYRLKN
jgi:beta-barrel assembly-enhancing protease